MLEKDLKFVLSKKDSIIIFNLSLVLLPAEVDLIAEKEGYKGDMFRSCDTSYVKMILALLTKIIALYIQGYIV